MTLLTASSTNPTPASLAASDSQLRWSSRAADVATRIAPDAAAFDRAGTFARSSFEILSTEGFLSAPIPTDLGGGGATFAETAAILTELAKGCPATAVTLSMHYHLVATQLWRHRHGLSGEAVLRKVAADNIVLVSTGASDWLDSSGIAARVEGGYRVSGRKAPASGAPIGGVAATSIAWPDSPDGPQVIHCSIPFSSEGVSVESTWDTMGLRGTGSDTVVFDDVFVPDTAVSLTRPAGVWHPVWDTVLGVAMPTIMAAYLGIAEAAADEATTQARRKADEPHVQTQIGELTNWLVLARDVVAAMVASVDDLQFTPSLQHTATVLARKSVAADALIAVVRQAMEITGGAGFATGGIERLYRDVHGVMYHPLPTDRQRLFTGRVALGHDPVTGH
jgi:alkylation response protein AidB-like acyl-CoA dehydrogenase